MTQDKLIEPPIDPEADLRDFPWLPLDHRRLTRSDLMWSVTADEFRAAVALWCEAWQQVPAGSLPDDDRVLAGLAGCGRGAAAIAEWQTLRAGALRGFVKATDGRLYHLVLVEKAVDAWQRKQGAAAEKRAHAEKMKRWREQKAKAGQDDSANTGVTVAQSEAKRSRDDHANPSRDGHVTDTCDDHVTSLKRTGTGTRTGNKDHSLPQPPVEGEVDSTKPKRKAKPVTYSAMFEAFWAVYPRKVGKVEAAKAFERALDLIGTDDAAAKLCAAATLYRGRMKGKDEQYVAHPSTWLNQGRWDDVAGTPEDDTPIWKRGANQLGVGG